MAPRVSQVSAHWWREMTTPARLLMAAKAAIGCALAWALAPLLPTQDEYSYYAPLGVLVSMYPTVAASARSGAQALLGLAIGIGLGLLGIGALFAGLPAVLTLALVIAFGVIIGGIRALGVGREWVAIAALFVLLLSGSQADDFSVSYLLTVGFGVLIGTVINFSILPPVYLDTASARLSELRDEVADLLRVLADRAAEGNIDAAEVSEPDAALDAVIADVHDEVHEADESMRGNPRGRRRRAEQKENLQRMRALERIAFYSRDLADVLYALDRAGDAAVGLQARAPLADAIRRCADLVATPVGDRSSRARYADADRAVESYADALTAAVGHAGVARRSTPVALLQRIIDAARPSASDGR
ncbi:FUSC family protein [Microbacterium sp. ET2]|uniref:FUSC family protein n=1 Tax=Microbacterium albipurpureum TaxID=3050384 RepID=UPI00259C7216|nr:FUSC family protein [Microbacterium sp. ET2 (Ac-2212)]WJL94809.1 FUSC family protein [Microbacterium sp. ET2 (Ac-2212)]